VRGSGDEEFRVFYERIHDRVTATAVRMVRDRSTGEDLAAEALARAFGHWRVVRSHPNPDAWLMAVVGNLVIDHVRRSGRDAARRSQLVTDGRDPGPPDQVAIRLDLANALNNLTARQRDVVLMRHYADMSEKSVAEALRISPGADKTHLHRATAQLRSELGVGRQPESAEPPTDVVVLEPESPHAIA
jgi:RNA polymerase sigma factor (sigma-70 family)